MSREQTFRKTAFYILLLSTTAVAIVGLAFYFWPRTEGKKDFARDFSYTLGHQYAKNLQRQQIESIDIESFITGINDTMNERELRLTEEEMTALLRGWQDEQNDKLRQIVEQNKTAGEKFLAEYRTNPGVLRTQSGLHFRILRQGNGPRPQIEDTVRVHYVGKLIDGTEFDSSYQRKHADEFPMKSVIRGWTEALLKMNEGSLFELIVPSDLAYGSQMHPKIPPGSTLIFEIELIAVKLAVGN